MAPTPLAIAQVVARNLVPVAGVLFLEWSAANVLILYFWDTLLAFTFIAAVYFMYAFPPEFADGLAARINAEVGYIGGGVMIALILAVPLGVPLVILLGVTDTKFGDLIADHSLRVGIVMQAIGAWWSYYELHRARNSQPFEALRLRRRFALVFLRWLALLMVFYLGAWVVFGHYAALLFVLVYAGISTFAEVAPDRFLRAMPGGADDADPQPGTAAPGAAATYPSGSKRHRNRKR